MSKAVVGGIYKHFKGAVYRVIHVNVTHSESGTNLVVYQGVQSKTQWARPKKIFEDILPEGMHRFKYVGLEDDQT